MPELPNGFVSVDNLDDRYILMMESIQNFFRFEKRNPEAYKFDDAYYEKVAEVVKKRLDHEIKHRNSPYLP